MQRLAKEETPDASRSDGAEKGSNERAACDEPGDQLGCDRERGARSRPPRAGRLAVIAILAFAPVAFAVTPQSRGVTGTYHSNWDDVTLVQDGDRVHGTYVCCGGGTIEGRIIEGRTLRYVWRQPSATGMGVWTIGDGRLDGTWGSGQSDKDGGRWDLQIAKPKSQIAN